jgi:hypothetical protein
MAQKILYPNQPDLDDDIKTLAKGLSNAYNAFYKDGGNPFIEMAKLLYVKVQISITRDTDGIKLVGDILTPGNSKYYGTDNSGIKGWYNIPGGLNEWQFDETLECLIYEK